MEAWAGFGGTNNWYGGWAGFNYAFNHNVWSDGLLFRVEGGGGHYDYTNGTLFNGVPVGFVNATYGQGAVMLGWRKVVPGLGQNTTVTGYVGAEVNDQNNPDPTAAVRGTKWGIKLLGEIYSRLNATSDFYGQASFGSAFDSWYVMARPGFLLPPMISGTELWIGPDMSFFGIGQGFAHSSCPNAAFVTTGLGSCRYSEGRIGGFLHIVIPNQPLWGDWVLSGGYRAPLESNSGPNGYYAQIGWYAPFR
jgi:hypothetical protein